MNFLRKNFGEIVVGVVLCGLIAGLMQLDLFAGTADKFDFGVFGYQEKAPRKDIVIVALDEKTINNPDFKRYQDIGREDYAQVLENVLVGNPSVVGVDVFFYNESKNAEADVKLAAVFRGHENLVAANEWSAAEQKLLQPNEVLGIAPSQLGYITLRSSSVNEKNLINKADVHFDKEAPYSTENEPFVFKIYRALSYGRQKAFFDQENNKYTITRNTEETVVPIQNGGVNINFYGKPHSFETVSFYDVWNGEVDASVFENKIVLVGETAADVHDAFFVPTSGGEFMPGVEIHANFLQTILEEDFIGYQSGVEKILVVMLVFVLLTVIYAYGSLALHFGLSALLVLGFYMMAIWSYRNGFIISYFWPSVMILLYWAGAHTVRFIRSEKTKQEIRDAFSKYVAKDVVDQILKNPEQINLGGESREVTIFFSDLVNFTHISEKLTPFEVNKMINIYLSEMSEIVLEERGTIDKYIGDAVMAYWGAPLPCPEHALKTCRAALAQRKALPKVNEKLNAENLPSLDMRIGIASGDVIAGNVGTSERMEYTVIGDDVNLASRLEGTNKQYGTHVMIAESTYRMVQKKFFTRELDSIRVKGKDEPIRIYELICETHEANSEQKICTENYEKGLENYRKQNWGEAEKYFAKNKDDITSQVMLDRISELKNSKLPEDWDGVHTFLSK